MSATGNKLFLRISALTPFSAELVSAAMDWMDDQFDEPTSFLRPHFDPITGGDPARYRSTCGTIWYALGLFIRDINNDRIVALKTIGNLVSAQIDSPGTQLHGTFPRGENGSVDPSEASHEFDFDADTREFVGVTLAIVLDSYEKQLPRDFAAGIVKSIRLIVEGMSKENPPPADSRVALLRAFLFVYAGDRVKNPAWVKIGEDSAGEVHRQFKVHGAFGAYNSPDYYGVDLLGLGLWRAFSPGQKLQDLAAEIEPALWMDIARHYHAGMRNLAGPFDFAEGMDMREYASLLGMCIWMAIGRELAPFPDTRLPFERAGNLSFATALVAVGVEVPDSVLAGRKAFGSERLFEQPLSGSRVATTWIGQSLMLGGESGERKPGINFQPGTVQWQIGDAIGWMRIQSSVPVDIRADKLSLRISLPRSTGVGEPAFDWMVYAPGADAKTFDHEHWVLPELLVRIESNLSLSAPKTSGALLQIRCAAPPSDPVGILTLRFSKAPLAPVKGLRT